LLCLLALALADIPFGGYDIQNTRFASDDTVTPDNANGLDLKWNLYVDKGVSATGTTAVIGGKTIVFFPDWGGNVYAVDVATGQLVWKKSITWYTGSYGSVSRTSIAIYDGNLVLGDQSACNLVVMNAATGALVWVKKLDPHPMCIITQAPTIDADGNIYVGLASTEEAWNRLNPGYNCCNFRGSMLSVSMTGAVNWQFYTVPVGYAGGGIWGSSASLDVARNLVYVATGNNYKVPADVQTCLLGANKYACGAADNYMNSVLALDMTTGALTWFRRFGAVDAWTQVCADNNLGTCGPDSDFSQGPMLSQIGAKDVIIAAQKSGDVICMDRDTGATIWQTKVNPNGIVGMRWGSTTDGVRVYVAIANDGSGWMQIAGKGCNKGAWTAINIINGQIVWQLCDPSGGQARGALTVNAAGVLFAGSTSGVIFAIEAATGRIIKTAELDAPVLSGPTVTEGLVMWGQGYRDTVGTTYNAYYIKPTPAPTIAPPVTVAPETEAPETQEPETEAPQTEAPETDPPTEETEEPTTNAPTTEDPTIIPTRKTGVINSSPTLIMFSISTILIILTLFAMQFV
jgi:polyvinyl alcohol dehydrogenase (cytochrome)